MGGRFGPSPDREQSGTCFPTNREARRVPGETRFFLGQAARGVGHRVQLRVVRNCDRWPGSERSSLQDQLQAYDPFTLADSGTAL